MDYPRGGRRSVIAVALTSKPLSRPLHPRFVWDFRKAMETQFISRSVRAPLVRLTHRQREVLSLLCRGLRNAEIGEQLGVSERTVKWYVSQLFIVFDVYK